MLVPQELGKMKPIFHTWNFAKSIGIVMNQEMALQITDLILKEEEPSPALQALLERIQAQFEYMGVL